MPSAEVELSVSQVKALVAEQAPHLGTHEVVPLAHGWDNFLFRLGSDWLARFPRRQVAVALINNEVRWLPELAPRLPLPIPVPAVAGQPGQGYPWPWTIVSWIEGAPVTASLETDLRGVATDLGAFLAALHRPAPDNAPPNPYRGVPLASRDRATRTRIGQLGSEIDSQAASACWDDALNAPEYDGPPIWLHGDLHPGNVIVASGRISGVVDFGDITAGDPATDLASIWTVLGGRNLDRFGDSYGETDEASWRRGRGWALSLGLAYLASSIDNPTMGRIGRRTLGSLLGDA